MLERDRRPQLISVSDVVGADGLPPPLPRSDCVFAAVWAAGRLDVAVVYGAASRWWGRKLFIADFDAVLYHGGFFADLVTRLNSELAKVPVERPCIMSRRREALIRHIHGVGAIEIPPWFDPARETLAFRRHLDQERAGPSFARRRLTRWRSTPWARR